jgi:hypothetical protein
VSYRIERLGEPASTKIEAGTSPGRFAFRVAQASATGFFASIIHFHPTHAWNNFKVQNHASIATF